MKNIDMSTLSPEVAAYIRSLEETVLEQKMELVKLQSLTEQLVNLRKKMYGQSSEKVQYVSGEQLSMYQDFFNEAETYSNASAPEPGKTTPVKAHERKSKRTKEELTAGLEHKKVLCELSPEERSCARCGTEMIKIGEKFARTKLVIVPAQVYAVDYYVASYKCAHCEKETGESFILQAESPVPVMKKSMAAPATVAHIMQEKFQKGVPLYRQEEYWKSQGVDLQRSTMANWIIRSSCWFQPLWDVLRKELLSSGIINADETECHVLKEDGRESKQMSRMWVFCSKEKHIALYQYNPTRSGTVAREMLKDYSGYLQTDGYSAYNAVEKATRVGCFAHARRKWVDCFVDGKPVKDRMSEKAFQLIERIFALESTWKGLPPEKRLEHRQKELKPVCLLGAPEQFRSGGEDRTLSCAEVLAESTGNVGCCPAGWPIRANEQFGGEKCETICDVAPELLVLRYGKRGNVQRFVFQHDRNSKGKQFGSIWISAVFAPGAAQTGRKA